MADEITSKILREIRDRMITMDTKFDARFDEMGRRMDGFEQRLMVVDHILRDVHGQVLILNRRVTKLEKKVA